MTVKRFGIAVGLVVCGLCFWVPQSAHAVALAESSISNTLTVLSLIFHYIKFF